MKRPLDIDFLSSVLHAIRKHSAWWALDALLASLTPETATEHEAGFYLGFFRTEPDVLRRPAFVAAMKRFDVRYKLSRVLEAISKDSPDANVEPITDAKPCPFCGGTHAYMHREALPYDFDGETRERVTFAVVCGSCAAQGPWVKVGESGEPSAIKRAERDWNKREGS